MCDFDFPDPAQVLHALSNPLQNPALTAVLINQITEALGLGAWFTSTSTITTTMLQTLVQELLQPGSTRTRNKPKLDCADQNISEDKGCGCKSVADMREDLNKMEELKDQLLRKWDFGTIIIGGGLDPCGQLAQAMSNRISDFHDCQLEKIESVMVCPSGARPKYCRRETIVKRCILREGEDPRSTQTAITDFWRNPLKLRCIICAKNYGESVSASTQLFNTMMVAAEHFSQLLGCTDANTRSEASLARCKYVKHMVEKMTTNGECPKPCIAWENVPGYKWVQC